MSKKRLSDTELAPRRAAQPSDGIMASSMRSSSDDRSSAQPASADEPLVRHPMHRALPASHFEPRPMLPASRRYR